MAIKSTDDRHKMEIVLKERRSGKPRELCAKAAGIPLSRITHWCNEGKQRIGKDNIYFYNTLMSIEKELEDRLKYEKESKEFSIPFNINKRKQFLENIRKGQTRKEASKNSKLDLKLIEKWLSLGRREIKPFYRFYREYTKAREESKRRDERFHKQLKNNAVNLIKKGKTLNQAAKMVHGDEYEKTIINWYNAGKRGDKNHVKFYKDCVNAQKTPVNKDILAPLPKVWKEFFKDKPMNKTGIAWVSQSGNSWTYSRHIDGKSVRFTDTTIRGLHKKVVGANYVWGIRDSKLARPIIFGSKVKTKVVVNFIRLSKKRFKVTIKGSIESKELRNVLNKLKFYEVDMVKKEIKQVGDKTDLKMELKLDTSLLNSFEQKVKSLGWKINK